MGKRIDLTGRRFGKLVVTGYSHSLKEDYGVTRAIWNCVCDCGNEIQVKADLLRNGHVRSCGCLKLEHEPKEDLTGQRFGRLTVIRIARRNKYKKILWECLCECGNKTEVISSQLKNGQTKSCGCLKRELTSERKTIHGLSHSKIRSIWKNMISRCENPKRKQYKDYGGRGITVCEEWHDLQTFAEWAYTNGFDENAEHHQCTLDRIDVNGNYEPSNCRFVDMKVQCRNKRYNHLIEYNGVVKTLAEWSEITGIGRDKIKYREEHGLPLFERRNLSESSIKQNLHKQF